MKRTYIIPTAAMLLAFTQTFAFNPLGLFSDSKAKEPAGRHIGLTDSRDGKAYMIVTIGNQTWMAENLNYRTSGSKCYNNNENYSDSYGRLYTWREALSVCPNGWSLPSKGDFETLLENVGGKKKAGAALKSNRGWFDNGNGTDKYNFGALPAGAYFGHDIFDTESWIASFWSWSNTKGRFEAYDLTLNFRTEDADLSSVSNPDDDGRSIRCIKNK